MKKKVINPDFLPAPQASFNRAVEIEIEQMKMLIISGTASVGSQRQTMYPNDLTHQAKYTYSNIKQLLLERGYAVSDVISWRIYLKDIDKYYSGFNEVRDNFFKENNVSRENMGSSTCVEAKLCRPDLLVEIEATAIKSS